jgi:hypothetical protein
MAEKDESVFEKQLQARAEWAKFEVTGNEDHGLHAIGLAESSGFGGEEKSALLKNTPELSKAFDEGFRDRTADYAIGLKESDVSEAEHLQKFGPVIPPTAGATYEGPIVHGDAKNLYQAVKIDDKAVLVMHERAALSSLHTKTLAQPDKPVNIRYIAEGVGIAKPVKEMDGLKSPEYQAKGIAGIGKG